MPVDRLIPSHRFIHLKGVLSAEEVTAANKAIDAHREHARERKGVLRNTRLRTPLAGDGKSGRMDLGGMLGWPDPHCKPFRDILSHPMLLPVLTVLCGPGYGQTVWILGELDVV